MSVLLFVCLVFITEIVASSYQTTSGYRDSTKYINDNQRNTRILVTENLNDTPGGTAQSINITEIKTNVTANSVTVISIAGQDMNGNVTTRPTTEGMETQSSQIVNSYPPYTSYEVTENVIDVPDNRRPAGPIVPNYTHYPPILNLARPNNKTNTDKTTEANNIKIKKNRLSIFHLNAEFDNKVQEVQENKVVGLFKGIKEYIHNFQKCIAKGFHSLFHKHQDEHDHGERFERAIVNEEVQAKSNGVQNVDKTDYNVRRRNSVR